MKRALKVLLWVVTIAVAVLFLAAVGLSLFFDPNDYKGQIAGLVRDRTGRELQIAGDLRLTFFPWLGVEVEGVELADAPGFGPQPFAQVARVQARVKLLPLVKRQVEMDTVVVHGLVLHLIKDAQGRGNWEDLAASAGTPPAAETPSKEGGGTPPAVALALGGLDVRDAQLVWQDQGQGSRYAVTGLNLHTGPLRLDGPVDVTLACNVESNAPVLTGHVDLSGTVVADLAGQQITIGGAHVVTRVTGAAVPGGEATADLAAALHVDLAKHMAQVRDLRATAALPEGGLPVGGKVTVTGAVDVDLTAQKLAADSLQIVAELAGATLPGGAATVTADMAGNADLGRQAVRLSHLDVTAVVPAGGTLGGRAEMHAALDIDLTGPRLRMAPARLAATATGGALPGGSATIAAETVVDADLAAQRVTLTALHGTVTTASDAKPVAGTVAVAGAITYDLAHSRLRAERLDVTTDLRGTALPGGALAATLSSRATVDLAAVTATFDDLRLRVLDLDVRGRVDLAKWSTTPTTAGQIELAPFDPRKLLDRLGQAQPACADAKVLGRASLKAKINGTATALRLSDLLIVLDDSKLTGTVAVDGFDRPAVRGDLALDALDVDRYLPPPAKGKVPSAPPPTPGATAGAATGLPLDTLRTLDLDATLRIGRLKAANVRVSDLLVTATAKGGEIRLHPATTHLYGGEYRGDVRLDARGPEPVLRLDETLAGVNAGPLLRDALGEERVTGKTTLHAQVTARGTGVDAITRTASGTAEFRVVDGAVRGVNLGRILREARAALALTKGQSLTPVRAVEETDFTELAGTLAIGGGKVRNDDLAAKSPLLRISGVGEVDLVREEVDYLLTATVVETRTGQGGKELDDLAGIPIPVRISGPFAKLEYRPDLRGVIKTRAETAVQKRLKKELDKRLTDKVPQDLRKDLEQGLKGLFP